jgi:hypothetical protein
VADLLTPRRSPDGGPARWRRPHPAAGASLAGAVLLAAALPAARPAAAAGRAWSIGSDPGLVCPAGPGTCSPGPPVAGLDCQVEQFPAAGSPLNAPDVPYEIPFTATLGPDPAPAGASTGIYPPGTEAGGWLEIRGTSRLLAGAQVVVILGGPVIGSKGFIYAKGCGRVVLPSQVGGIGANQYPPTGTGGQVNPNFEFYPATPVSIGVTLPGISLSPNVASPIVAYGSADGFLSSDIQRQPAADGGLNVDFYSTAKSTTNLSYLLSLLGTSVGGSDCTVTIGDLRAAGLPVPAGGIDGLTYAQATTPVHLSTTQSVPDPVTGQADVGQPVTGPIAPKGGHAQDSAVLTAGGFPIGAINPAMPPSPGFPGTATCSATNANLLNSLIGLPNPTQNYFYAPGTFGVFTSS